MQQSLKYSIITTIVVLWLPVVAIGATRSFSHPERIHYDAQCLTIDGQDVFLYSGAFHYFRCPKELWSDRFEKIRAAGFNAVESYVAWNWHEPQMPAGLDDFSKVDLSELEEWLTMAEQFGFYIIIRPGPYVCAEWDNGGFPRWLLTQKPAGVEHWLRGDDPVFLAWSKHWYDAVCPLIARHQITHKSPGEPGVVLFQLENEYDYASYAHFSDQAQRNHIKALARAACDNGIDVPLFTCWTHCVRGQDDPLLREVFDSCNFYLGWNVDQMQGNVEKLRREQPDAPLMTTELQGGWFSRVGGQLSENQDGLTGAQINNLTLFAVQNGETILNYYMLFGGTNFGDRAARNITTTYDYNAPIREWGGVDERYQRVRALGAMLSEHGTRLARAISIDCDVTVDQEDVGVALRRATDGSRYLFVRTSQHSEPREGNATVREKNDGSAEWSFHYKLEPFGSKILYLPPDTTEAEKGQWLPKHAAAIERPRNLPAPVVIGSARRLRDPGPPEWKPMQSGQSLEQLGIYDSRFVFYQVRLGNHDDMSLVVEHTAGDNVMALVRGIPAQQIGGGSDVSGFALPANAKQLILLYENHGYANGGARMENRAGIFSVQLTSRSLIDTPISNWRMHEVNDVTQRPEAQSDFDDKDWAEVSVDQVGANNLVTGRTAVYRATVELTDAELQGGKTNLKIARIDDLGWVYVNGEQVGETTDWSREYAFDVSRQLHPGRNVIAVIVQNKGGDGGLGKPTLDQQAEGTKVELESYGFPAGLEGQWWETNFDDSQWEPIALGDQAAESHSDSDTAELNWYRMKFELQPLPAGVWAPWRLQLKATGNGFLYLNGRPLGRYWQAGPQEDFFLPECWLNVGPGLKNILTLCLRPIDRGATIQSAIVRVYENYAERR